MASKIGIDVPAHNEHLQTKVNILIPVLFLFLGSTSFSKQTKEQGGELEKLSVIWHSVQKGELLSTDKTTKESLQKESGIETYSNYNV